MMNSLDRGGRRKSLKERLGFVGLGCCGGGAALSSNMSIRAEEEEEAPQEPEEEESSQGQIPAVEEQDCVGQNPAEGEAVGGMNLATALAAERQFRAENEEEEVGESGGGGARRTPMRMSLMRLLEEGDGVDEKMKAEEGGGGGGGDGLCCVCMGRRKGAAFIPCGHTFCRVCSRELWLNRGTCPICNRSILEILDIF